MENKWCEIMMDTGEICGRGAFANGMCMLHYTRARNGTPMGAPYGPQTKGNAVCVYCDDGRPAVCRDMCVSHYDRWVKGKPLEPPIRRRKLTDEEKVDFLLSQAAHDPNGCLIAERIGGDGYATGVKDENGRSIKTHRLVYRVKNREPRPREQVHHACGNRACIEPSHLVGSTQVENTAEMKARVSYEATIAALEEENERLRERLTEGTAHHE